MSEYIAGSCNIGPSEIHRRYQSAIAGAVLYAIAFSLLIATGQPKTLRLIAFAPAMVAAVGYVQAKNRFCFAYGLIGVFNFDKAGDVTKIKDPAALKADRAHAAKILVMSFALAAAMTAIVVLI